MPKIEPGSEPGQFLLDGLPYRTSLYEPVYENNGVERFGIRRAGTRNTDRDFLKEVLPIGDWTKDDDSPLADLTDIATYLSTFFFRDLGNSESIDGGSVAELRLIFKETFIGDGISNSFQLQGNIVNAVFSEGSFDVSRISTTSPVDIVRTDNQKPTYDGVPNFLNSKISVVSVSPTGLVLLSAAPRSGVSVDVYYWYQTQDGDVITGYERNDYVSSMEADNDRIDAKLDDHINEEGNVHNLDHEDIPDFDTGVRQNRLDQMTAPSDVVLMNIQQLKNLAAPSDLNDAVRLVDVYKARIYQANGLINQTVAFEPFFINSPSLIKNSGPNLVLSNGVWTWTVPVDGDFDFWLNYRHSYNQGTSNFLAHVLVDGVDFDFPLHIEPKDTGGTGVSLPTVAGGVLGPNVNSGTDQFVLAHGKKTLIGLVQGDVKTFEFEFACQNAGQEATIYEGTLGIDKI